MEMSKKDLPLITCFPGDIAPARTESGLGRDPPPLFA